MDHFFRSSWDRPQFEQSHQRPPAWEIVLALSSHTTPPSAIVLWSLADPLRQKQETRTRETLNVADRCDAGVSFEATVPRLSKWKRGSGVSSGKRLTKGQQITGQRVATRFADMQQQIQQTSQRLPLQ